MLEIIRSKKLYLVNILILDMFLRHSLTLFCVDFVVVGLIDKLKCMLNKYYNYKFLK